MATAIEIAGYIKESLNIPSYDSMKIQKLLYFAHAWHLAWTGRELVEEPFEAWPQGPVVRSVFAKNKYEFLPKDAELDAEQCSIIDAVLRHYGDLNYSELVELTHEDEPWLEARQGLSEGAKSQTQLNRATMLDFYVHQGLRDGDIPHRPIHAEEADEAEAQVTALAIAKRWQSGLELLATK